MKVRPRLNINNQQIYNPYRMYAPESYSSNNYEGAIFDYKGFCTAVVLYDNEECPDEIMDAPLSEAFFARRMKVLNKRYGFMLYGNMVVDIFSTSELLYPDKRIRLRLIRATPICFMIKDNPNVRLGIVDCSICTRRISFKDDYRNKRLDLLA